MIGPAIWKLEPGFPTFQVIFIDVYSELAISLDVCNGKSAMLVGYGDKDELKNIEHKCAKS